MTIPNSGTCSGAAARERNELSCAHAQKDADGRHAQKNSEDSDTHAPNEEKAACGGESFAPFVLALVGPTASGKSALALALAKRIGRAGIVSCDSMQIYRRMDIGTAKPTKEERAAVPHRLIDIREPSEAFSAENFRTEALAAIRDFAAEGRLPLLVGGTGLYLDTLLRAPSPAVPESRADYRRAAEALGADALWERLCAVDPAAAEKTHKNNLRRVIRALEIYDATGMRKSELDARSKAKAPDLRVGMILLDFHDRENLYRRTDRRVDEMFAAGLWQETADLLRAGDLAENDTAAQAIGYKEIARAIRTGESPEVAREAVRLATRHYAKRQLTWFRHEEGAYRLFIDREDGTLRPQKELADEAMHALNSFLNTDPVEPKGTF